MSRWSKFVGIFQPSLGVRRQLRKLRDRWKSQFYEGPEPPPRIADEVALFMLVYPEATPEQWRAFAVSFGQNSYRDGFVRGYEWLERDWGGPAIDPERLAEMQSHDWSLADTGAPRYDLIGKGAFDPRSPLAGATPAQRRAFMETLNILGKSPHMTTIIDYGNEFDERPDSRSE